ncbi:citron Rho-interacting kinase-like [Clupea harengus]|uniref:Citron Rho-interacting kinase-like n=1 Tax=Clupea harengus TaxID=7950 RepID=A0A6P8FIY3_CLUHA|nr:citron Rho-interacting kinase-like [Clupea harengus]
MDSADTETVRGLPLREQRIRIQQLEKESEHNAAREILENDHKLPRDAKTLGNYLLDRGPALQNIVEKQQRRLCTLVEQHNGLQYTLRLRESQLLEMENTMKSLERHSNPDPKKRHYDQSVRLLENCLEKMSMKITEAEHIQNTYIRVEEHIHREVREMPQVLDKLQSTVMRGQTELSEVAQISQSALAAVESTKGMLVQLERQLMTERQVIDGKLNTKHLEKERGVEGRLEREEGDRRISRASNRSKDQKKSIMPKEDLTDTIDPVGVRVAQKSPTPTNTQQSHMKMAKEMDDLKEALGCTDLQELESRLVSQTATQQQLHTQMKQCEERAAQKQEELAALELQYAQIKFNPGPGCER